MVNKSLMIIAFVLLFSAGTVIADDYGNGYYGVGDYGIGEGGGGGGGTGGEDGSATATTVTATSPGPVSYSADGSSFTSQCESSSCRITSVVASEADLPREFEGVEHVVNLECTGSLGETTLTREINDCDDNVGVTVIHDDGSEEEAEVSCSEDTLTATWQNGCGYVVIWRAEAVAEEPAVEAVAEEPAVEAEPVEEAVGPSRTGLILVILGVIVILVIGFVVFKRKHH